MKIFFKNIYFYFNHFFLRKFKNRPRKQTTYYSELEKFIFSNDVNLELPNEKDIYLTFSIKPNEIVKVKKPNIISTIIDNLTPTGHKSFVATGSFNVSNQLIDSKNTVKVLTFDNIKPKIIISKKETEYTNQPVKINLRGHLINLPEIQHDEVDEVGEIIFKKISEDVFEIILDKNVRQYTATLSPLFDSDVSFEYKFKGNKIQITKLLENDNIGFELIFCTLSHKKISIPFTNLHLFNSVEKISYFCS